MHVVAALRRLAAPRGRLPAPTDAVLVLVLVAPTFWSHRGGILAPLLGVGVALPTVWRRQAPVAAFAVAFFWAAVQGLVASPTFSNAALLLDLYTIGAYAPRRTAVGAWAALEVGAAAAALKFGHSGFHETATAFVALSAMATAAVVIGINVGNRRQIMAALRERATRLESEREQEVALARASERARIAREMHDVVAHNLSVMVALCDGAAYHVHDDPERTESALEQAARTGRQALAEMRQLLGVLRDAPPQPSLAPQPGVRQLGDLVEQVRGAGLPVSYTMTGQLAGVAPGVELAIYRIVQEALTNTLKHGGPGATATVKLTCVDGIVEIDVRDTGLGSRPHDRPAGQRGAGLRGMRERAAVYDGTLVAGPGDQGGWHVHASLSVPAPVGAAGR